MSFDIYKAAKEQGAYMTAMRRELHEHPEVSGKETETRARIIRELDKIGAAHRPVPGTGIVAVIEGSHPGKTKMLRADIDALPIQEEEINLAGQKLAVSKNPGVCHACGHDSHVAMLLGAIRVISEHKDELPGRVVCCFEEGEEVGGGIEAMLREIEGEGIEECFALHVLSSLRAGVINIEPGPRMAGNFRIDFTIKGRAGHGSRPDQSINPIVPAAHIITEINSAFMNQIDVEKTVTMAICMVQSGTAGNIIPETAQIKGTSRFFDVEQGRRGLDVVQKIIAHTCDIHGCTVDNRTAFGLRPVVNVGGVAERVAGSVARVCGTDTVSDCDKWYASESYGRYLEKYSGALGFLGIQNDKLGSGAAHHNGRFDLDESVMPLGAAAELCFAFEI